MSEMRVELAKLLLRRKELDAKVKAAMQIKAQAVYEVKVQRVRVTESIDEVTAQVPKLILGQVTHELDWHSRQLRQCDAAIQKANWDTLVPVESEIMDDYVPPDQQDWVKVWNKK